MKTIPAIYENGVFRPIGPVDLPEGCEVTVGTIGKAATTGENWFDYLQRTRAEREASGARFRSKEEINAMRDEWDRDSLKRGPPP